MWFDPISFGVRSSHPLPSHADVELPRALTDPMSGRIHEDDRDRVLLDPLAVALDRRDLWDRELSLRRLEDHPLIEVGLVRTTPLVQAPFIPFGDHSHRLRRFDRRAVDEDGE